MLLWAALGLFGKPAWLRDGMEEVPSVMAAPLQHLLWLQWEAVCPAQSWEPCWESLCCSAVFQHIFASVLSLGSSICNLAINRFFLQLQTGAGCFRGTWALVISHCCSSNAGDCHENPSESNLFPIPRKTPRAME